MRLDSAIRIISFHARIYAPDGNVCRTYLDHYERLAIGYDHTRTTIAGQRITHEEADALLCDDLEGLRIVIPPLIEGAELGVYQWNALLSFAHSMRFADFKQTTVLARIRCRRLQDVSAEIAKHTQHVTRTLHALTKRRASESELWQRAI